MRLSALLLLGAACAPYMNVPTAMHPTRSAGETSVGVAVGAGYVNPEATDSNELFAVPHAEGWLRWPVMADAQLGVHAGPGVGHLALRYDVMPNPTGGVGIAVEPVVGGGYGVVSESVDDQSQKLISLSGGVAVLFLIPVGAGHAYVIPKVGFGWFKQYDDSDMTEEEGNKLYTLGLSAGIDVAPGVSIELAIHRIDDAEDEAAMEPDAEPVWFVVPTIGLRR
jgi:hypothetical protein